LGGVARERNMQSLEIGGTENHIHILIELPRTLSVAKAIQSLKAVSSTWVSRTFDGLEEFKWQNGYGVFSVSMSKIKETKEYIRNQKDHHRHRTFREEFLLFLDKHGIEYNEKYLFD